MISDVGWEKRLTHVGFEPSTTKNRLRLGHTEE